MDEKIRELCRSNLRENLKKVETEGELEKLDAIQDVTEAAEDEKDDQNEQGVKSDIEEDLYQIIQDALKRKAQDELPPPEEVDRAQKKV